MLAFMYNFDEIVQNEGWDYLLGTEGNMDFGDEGRSCFYLISY